MHLSPRVRMLRARTPVPDVRISARVLQHLSAARTRT